MKITSSAMFNIYNANNKPLKSTEKSVELKQQNHIKTDTVSISKENVQEMKMRKNASDIVNEVLAEDSPSKIKALKSLVEKNLYKPTSSSIADAIVDRFYNFKKEVK